MDYLLIEFRWYVALLFAIGLFVGWFSCSRVND